jgi:hypothetical protein
LFGLSTDDATATIRYFKWNMDKLQNEWFDNVKKLRTKIGLDFDQELLKASPHMNASLSRQNGNYCMICYSEFCDEGGDNNSE